jgi:hypothetical protein
MAAPFKARTVFDLSNNGIAGSKPARGRHGRVSAFVYVLLSCVSRGLASG